MQIINDTSAMIPEPCVATIGFFDGVHTGHRYLIQQVKEIAAAKGLRSALVTFPVHPRKVMNATYHPELLTTPEEKINLLAGTGVDYCLMLDFTPDISRLTAKEFMTQVLKERYQVRYLVIGYDHRFGHNRSEGFEDYVRYGQSIGPCTSLHKRHPDRCFPKRSGQFFFNLRNLFFECTDDCDGRHTIPQTCENCLSTVWYQHFDSTAQYEAVRPAQRGYRRAPWRWRPRPHSNGHSTASMT